MTTPVRMMNSVTTRNGYYYVGMTRAEAEEKGKFKRFIGLDFKSLDNDKNGCLSQREVLTGVQVQTARNMLKTSALGGAVMILGNAIAFAPGASKLLFGIGALLVGGGAASIIGGIKSAFSRGKEVEQQLEQLQ